jgi:antitoxin component of RelBE/YafQ-DinJ toxin-antitoxin module
MTFFRDPKGINLLSKDDQLDIASNIFSADSAIINSFFKELISDKYLPFKQLMKQENSLPVF